MMAKPRSSEPSGVRRRMPEVAVLVSWLLMFIGVLWAASAERTEVRRELLEQKNALGDHEVRLRVLEKQIGEIVTDVRWIRQRLEQQGRP